MNERPDCRHRVSVLLVCLIVGGCSGAAVQPSSQQPSSTASNEHPAPIRIVAAIMSDPTILNTTIGTGDGNLPGMDALEQLVHAGLSIEDNRGVLNPQLAEAVPSTVNGLWRLFPDGRMDTTWKIRPGAKWHDGTAFTASDLDFTTAIGQDREVPAFGNAAYNSLDSVEVVDPQTFVIHWRRPFIGADTMFTRQLAAPLPRQILEPAYLQDKSTFVQLPYWGQEFVGAGPYRITEWMRGSHLRLAANDQYVLGRPQIDDIEVKLIPDPNTLVANVLAGAVDVTIGRGPSVEQALQARNNWASGGVEINFNGWIVVFPK